MSNLWAMKEWHLLCESRHHTDVTEEEWWYAFLKPVTTVCFDDALLATIFEDKKNIFSSYILMFIVRTRRLCYTYLSSSITRVRKWGILCSE